MLRNIKDNKTAKNHVNMEFRKFILFKRMFSKQIVEDFFLFVYNSKVIWFRQKEIFSGI